MTPAKVRASAILRGAQAGLALSQIGRDVLSADDEISPVFIYFLGSATVVYQLLLQLLPLFPVIGRPALLVGTDSVLGCGWLFVGWIYCGMYAVSGKPLDLVIGVVSIVETVLFMATTVASLWYIQELKFFELFHKYNYGRGGMFITDDTPITAEDRQRMSFTLRWLQFGVSLCTLIFNGVIHSLPDVVGIFTLSILTLGYSSVVMSLVMWPPKVLLVAETVVTLFWWLSLAWTPERECFYEKGGGIHCQDFKRIWPYNLINSMAFSLSLYVLTFTVYPAFYTMDMKTFMRGCLFMDTYEAVPQELELEEEITYE